MFGQEPENQVVASGQTSIIAQGCKFEGKVQVGGTLRVEGEFKGSINKPESLVSGKTGGVHGDVKVKNAIIGGQLFGNIIADNKIELQSGSHVEGDIKTKRLVIDEGVFFEGNCSMGAKPTGATSPSSSPSPSSSSSLGAKEQPEAIKK